MQTTNLWVASGAIFRYFDWGATLLWAWTGAARAARRGYDLTGIFATALATACGGGLLRDALFLQAGPPALVRSPMYVSLAALAAFSVWIAGADGLRRTSRLFARATGVADGIGLGAFAVVGMRLASTAGIGLAGASLVGVVNAVGGGLVGSALLQETPEVLRPGHFTAVAAVVGTLVYACLERLVQVPADYAGAVTIAVVAGLHWASLRYRLHTHAAWNLASRWTRATQISSPHPKGTPES